MLFVLAVAVVFAGGEAVMHSFCFNPIVAGFLRMRVVEADGRGADRGDQGSEMGIHPLSHQCGAGLVGFAGVYGSATPGTGAGFPDVVG